MVNLTTRVNRANLVCKLCPSHRTIDPSARELSMFKEELNKAIQTDPLTHLDPPQKELIWKFRSYCSTIPEALPKLLCCLDWANLDDVSGTVLYLI